MRPSARAAAMARATSVSAARSAASPASWAIGGRVTVRARPRGKRDLVSKSWGRPSGYSASYREAGAAAGVRRRRLAMGGLLGALVSGWGRAVGEAYSRRAPLRGEGFEPSRKRSGGPLQASTRKALARRGLVGREGDRGWRRAGMTSDQGPAIGGDSRPAVRASDAAAVAPSRASPCDVYLQNMYSTGYNTGYTVFWRFPRSAAPGRWRKNPPASATLCNDINAMTPPGFACENHSSAPLAASSAAASSSRRQAPISSRLKAA